MKWSKVIGLAFLPAQVLAVASTDSLQDVVCTEQEPHQLIYR
jgi:hypothetical protein